MPTMLTQNSSWRRESLVRYRARVDRNQPEIVAALRELGCSVEHLHTLGRGVPDLLVGLPDGVNVPVEVKVGNEPLTPDEERWHRAWRGRVVIVRSVEEARKLVLGDDANA